MPTATLATAPLKVPRFVENLNAIASAHNLSVGVEVAPYDDRPEVRLWSRWSGPITSFYALGLLSRSQHLPQSRGYLAVPAQHFHGRALLAGELTVTDDTACWDIDWCPADFQIASQGPVEVLTFSDWVFYHGTAEALVEAGIERKRLPNGKRNANDSFHAVEKCPAWRSRRQPDGTILYREETASEFARRLAEQRTWDETTRRVFVRPDKPTRPAYLRLVIDNTRSISNP